MINKDNQHFYSKGEILEGLNAELSLVRGLGNRDTRKHVGKLRQAIIKVTQGRRKLYPSNSLRDILQA